MSAIRVVVKATAGGQRIEREVEPGQTILEVKEALAEACGIPAPDQRLIYKGQILKDERTVESYGIGSDHVLHLVRAKPSGASQSPSTSTSGVAAARSAAAAGGGSPGAAAGGAPGGAPAGAGPAIPGLAGLMDPAAMQQMMQSPIMQQLLNNPDLLRGMLQANPAVRQLMDRDPQMAQLLNNPELLRDSMNLMANPNLMREYMRNNDRAMSNIEALPGGFNALRQLYENVQEPLLNATTGSDAVNPMASLMQGAAHGATSTSGGGASGGGSDQPGSQPLPNPWAPQQPAGGSGGGAAANPAGLAALMAGGGAAAAGGRAGMGEMTAQLLEDPAMRETMISMMSQPGMIEAIAGANPQLRQMLDSLPGMRETMRNPEMLRMMLDPQVMRSMVQHMGGAGGGGGMDPAMLASMLSGGAGGPGGAGGAAGPGMEGLMGMLNAMGMGGLAGLGGMGGLGGPAPVADPATTYAAQIQQLQDMGFFDPEANIRALQATGGNVNAAVDRLLNGL